MDLSINLEKLEKKIKIDTQINTQKLKIFFVFKLSNSKSVKDLQNTQNPNTQKIENPNPDLNLWVFGVHLSD